MITASRASIRSTRLKKNFREYYILAFISNTIPSPDGKGMGGGENSSAKGESAEVDEMPALIKRGRF